MIAEINRAPGKRTDIEPAETDFGRFLKSANLQERTAQNWQSVARIEPFLLDGAELVGVWREVYSDGSEALVCDLRSALWRYNGPPTFHQRERSKR